MTQIRNEIFLNDGRIWHDFQSSILNQMTKYTTIHSLGLPLGWSSGNWGGHRPHPFCLLCLSFNVCRCPGRRRYCSCINCCGLLDEVDQFLFLSGTFRVDRVCRDVCSSVTAAHLHLTHGIIVWRGQNTKR